MKITKDMILNAYSYISISEKEHLARLIADSCVVEGENGFFYERFAVKVMQEGIMFLSAYLGVDVTLEEGMSAQEQFDTFFSDHIFNQIERLKTDNDIKSKIFDILLDYKEFCKFIDKEIERLIREKNDTVTRLGQFVEQHPEIKVDKK